MKFGIIPELVGRLPVIAPLESLGKPELVRNPERAEECACKAV